MHEEDQLHVVRYISQLNDPEQRVFSNSKYAFDGVVKKANKVTKAKAVETTALVPDPIQVLEFVNMVR